MASASTGAITPWRVGGSSLRSTAAGDTSRMPIKGGNARPASSSCAASGPISHGCQPGSGRISPT
ncbi:Uncharacterised protein [Chromobacterium violaceum]|uniref:Uncharacterized protein n=1 Tax=Chromobacterium violaceum TaxID=536 RepID=A0A447TJB0_CHRVL|nr:Uncharacterised protein [Chromobacterium violaceum]